MYYRPNFKYKWFRIVTRIWTAHHCGIEVGGNGLCEITSLHSLPFNMDDYLFAVYFIAIFLFVFILLNFLKCNLTSFSQVAPKHKDDGEDWRCQEEATKRGNLRKNY